MRGSITTISLPRCLPVKQNMAVALARMAGTTVEALAEYGSSLARCECECPVCAGEEEEE
jgi:hypothetical protein